MGARVIPFKSSDSNKLNTSDPAFAALQKLRQGMVRFLSGKEDVVDAMLASMLSSGHILLEDVPGVGKTTAIRAVAKLLGLEIKRIQCTSDLLPSDIIGTEVFDSKTQSFVFHHGPVFSNIVMADELNRASPRTQSALLEAMGEGYVSVDRKSHALPAPFILFASQNPSDHVGCYPLPESQLDRFSVKIHLNYPINEKEREIFSLSAKDPVAQIEGSVLDKQAFLQLQQKTETIHISDKITDYVKRVVDRSRSHEKLRRGISTRGGVIWLRVARARALVRGRDYVVPDDLIELAPMCLSHRVVSTNPTEAPAIIASILEGVDVD